MATKDKSAEPGASIMPPETETPAAETMWGAFKVEVGVPVKAPSKSKYDWEAFPAPTNPADSSTWPSVMLPKVQPKTIYSSIRTYRDAAQKAGKTPHEFQVSVVKDSATKDTIGVRVFRKA